MTADRRLLLCAGVSGVAVAFWLVARNRPCPTDQPEQNAQPAAGRQSIPALATKGLVWYVARNGSDTWSGRLPAPNAIGSDGPFASLERARGAVREWRRDSPSAAAAQCVSVLVRGGVYYLAKSFILGPQDSGTEQSPVTYAAYPGETVELKGSRPVSGWTRVRGSVYRAQAPAAAAGETEGGFRQLFYRGQRQILARCPNVDDTRPRTGGFLYLTASLDAAAQSPMTAPARNAREDVSRIALQYDPSRLDPGRWTKPAEARIQVWPRLNWSRDCVGVASVDLERHQIRLRRPASYPLTEGNRFFVEGVKEELDSPGEWYYDEASGELLFWPPDGENPEGQVTVPHLPALVELRGTAERNEFVQHVSFRGFHLSESADALVRMRMAAHCTIAACALEWCGGTAIDIAERSHHNRVAGCDIAHTGGRGIVLTEVRDWTHSLVDRISYNTVCNNHVHDVGELQTAVGAIAIEPACGGNVSHDNVVCHNLIHDTPHQGIRFDGFWNVVEYNRIHHTNLEFSDSGGIGMGSRDIHERGSVIRHNLIHDTGGYSMASPGVWRYPHFTWGVYLDDYTSGVTLYGNIIARAPRGGIKVHGGQDNTIENNIIVDCGGQQVELDPIDGARIGSGWRRPGEPDRSHWRMTGTRVVRNVFRYRDRQALWLGARQPKWQQMLARSDANLIWREGGSVTVGLTGRRPGDENMTWAAWRAMGFDGQSVVADPLFMRPECDDYRLKTGSPAWALGFQAIPVDRIGLFASPERASWPVRSDCFPREQPLTRPAAGRLGRLRGWVRDQAVERMPWLREWRKQLQGRPASIDSGSERR